MSQPLHWTETVATTWFVAATGRYALSVKHPHGNEIMFREGRWPWTRQEIEDYRKHAAIAHSKGETA